MSYSTIGEATEYVETHYLSTDEVRTSWGNLSEDDKQVLLNKAFTVIESLPFTGHKASVDQPNAFPRCPDTEVPDAVKQAEIELALSFSDSEASETLKDYRKMVDYGINSYSIGNFSETLLTYSKNSLQMQYGLISEEAERLLKPWMYGGYNICP